MSYAVMPLSDYDATCDKVREKVDLTTVRFEETNFGYLRSAAFAVKESGTYTFTIEVKDESKLNIYEAVFGNVDWNPSTQPGQFDSFDGSTASGRFGQGVETCIYVSNSGGLNPSDIISATLSYNGEVVENFVAPPKIKSGELADKVEEVYKAGASDFGLKGKGQGEFVHLEPVHPIEHKVTVGLSSKNLFDISKIESTAVITNNNDGTLTIIGTYSARTGKTLGELCPPLKVGDTVVFQVETTGNPLIYLSGSNYTWNTGGSKTVTEADLTSIVVLYGKSDSGTYTISNIQIEAGTIATAYTPYITDFSDCKVYARGKNLLNLEGREVVNFGSSLNTTKRTFFNEKAIILGLASNNYCNNTTGDFEITENTISCLQKATSYGIGFDVKVLPNTTYRFSSEERIGETVRLLEYDAEGNFIKSNYITNASVTTTADVAWGVVLFVNQTSNSEHYVKNPQLEYGSVITEYEPPISETEYTTAADGTVEGVKSISPVMNLSTDKAGAVIDAECFLDPQAVLTSLTNTVITLGGEV